MSPVFQTKATQPAIHHTNALFQWVNPIARLNARNEKFTEYFDKWNNMLCHKIFNPTITSTQRRMITHLYTGGNLSSWEDIDTSIKSLRNEIEYHSSSSL